MVPLYWFAYAAPPAVLSRGTKEADASNSLHMLRDGQAFVEVLAFLAEDHRFKATLLNYPQHGYKAGTLRRDHGAVEAGALIVQTTRPPLDDAPPERRRIERSGSPLETSLLSALRVMVRKSQRTRLSFESAAEHLGAEAGAQSKAPPIGYVLSHPHVKQRDGTPVRYLLAFGFDGTQTLLLCNLIRTHAALGACVRDALSCSDGVVIRVDYGIEDTERVTVLRNLPAQIEDITASLPVRIRSERVGG